MARFNTTHIGSAIGEYGASVAMGLAFVICMPLVGVALFLLRGAMVAGIGVAIAVGAAVGVWHLVEPKLSPSCRLIVRDVAVGAAMVASIPLLGILTFVMQGTVTVLLPVACVLLAVAGLWRILTAGRHAFPGRPKHTAPRHRGHRSDAPEAIR